MTIQAQPGKPETMDVRKSEGMLPAWGHVESRLKVTTKVETYAEGDEGRIRRRGTFWTLVTVADSQEGLKGRTVMRLKLPSMQFDSKTGVETVCRGAVAGRAWS